MTSKKSQRRTNGSRKASAKRERALVIVESPAKAKTVSRILGAPYEVKASIGHVRDLPKSSMGVEISDDFTIKYVVPRDKAKAVKEIREAAQQAGRVYLATDPDREGEAIAWHLIEAADLEGLPHSRVVFHEITPQAVQEAFRHPRDIDMPLVDAQQARRVLDRLVGYRLSPFLWQKVRRGLSAGRVQSVALRLVVEREREIQNFVSQEYWTIEAALEKKETPPSFKAKLMGYAGKKQKLEIHDETEAQRLLALSRDAAYTVLNVQYKTQSRKPSAPFITSTLQQEASRRLGFSAKRTMALAQQLYEGLPLGSGGEVGLITYMRTDSTNVAESARHEARDFISERFGAEFLPHSPRQYGKVKGAQEAHEAIRPTTIRREPETVKPYLTRDQLKLYTLVWQRMIASQMADARFEVLSVDIEAKPYTGKTVFLFRATNTQMRFSGFRQVYVEGRDDGEEEDEGTNPMPDLDKGEALRLLDLIPEQHFTQPPARYTEASLVKALEEKGIGRPSTYAPTLSTIQDRGYVEKEGRQLKPSELGFLVNDLLVENFPIFVNAQFTADMEQELDDVAEGDRPWQPVVREFYNPLEEALKKAESVPKAEQQTAEICPECGRPMVIRWGRRGRFLACSGFPECRTTRPLEGEEEAPQPTDEKCPECGAPMVVKSGRFGRFLACSRYPECKGTRPFAAKVGVSCPKCGGDILERRSKRGRTFYGCSNYPKCDFTAWSRPLPRPCPICGSLLLAEREGKAKCTACNWRGEMEEEPAPEPSAVN